ncbi:MAG: hypothetical protein LIP08_10895 [Bacteroides sp.]|nr:hypothetical protein [Bacteroides sp.]
MDYGLYGTQKIPAIQWEISYYSFCVQAYAGGRSDSFFRFVGFSSSSNYWSASSNSATNAYRVNFNNGNTNNNAKTNTSNLARCIRGSVEKEIFSLLCQTEKRLRNRIKESTPRVKARGGIIHSGHTMERAVTFSILYSFRTHGKESLEVWHFFDGWVQ